MSKYGEPFSYEESHGEFMQCVKDRYGDVVLFDAGERMLRRCESCLNAMTGIEHPTEFMAEVRELLQDCKDFVAENEVATIPAHAHGLSAADGCPCCGELADDGHAVDCATIRLRTRISVMLARLEPAGNQGRIEEPR